MIQRRRDGSVNFCRTLERLCDGCKCVTSMESTGWDYEKIHRLTKISVPTLRVDLTSYTAWQRVCYK